MATPQKTEKQVAQYEKKGKERLISKFVFLDSQLREIDRINIEEIRLIDKEGNVRGET